jgi:hypothetical protein
VALFGQKKGCLAKSLCFRVFSALIPGHPQGIKRVFAWPVLTEFWRKRDALGWSVLAFSSRMRLALKEDKSLDQEQENIVGPDVVMQASSRLGDLLRRLAMAVIVFTKFRIIVGMPLQTLSGTATIRRCP